MDLSQRQVHLWLTDPLAIGDAGLLAAYAGLLTDGEQARRARYRFERDRHTFLVTRALVRTVLSRYCDVRPADWRFVDNEYGRPAIAEPVVGPPPSSNLCFNLSHTDGLIACAVAWDREIGVDVERVGDRATVAIAEDFFAEPEVAALRKLAEPERIQQFHAIWTLKESYIKARGMGLAIPLDQFWFDLDRGPQPTIEIDSRLDDSAETWQFERQRPTSDHHLALAIRRQGEPDLSVAKRHTVPLAGDSEPSWLRSPQASVAPEVD
ncbi:MAG: 4-phosphopantetheinyl transferase [Deltaproteobacteria bacterium]|nr:MAG: 4-phosphopantetheinyl transferase [Deltaproteobacteria bacterium]